jgi:pSer/pThr/pTyr-binding forkhead associated (FHA) protein
MGRPVIKMLLGALTGILVWMIMEPSAPRDVNSSLFPAWSGQFTVFLGVAIGLVISGFNGWSQGSKIHLIRGLALGAFLGLIGVTFGANIGNSIVSAMVPNGFFENPTIPAIVKIPERMIALTPIGTFLGAAIGASSLNWRRVIQGAIGGTIGAGIGAAVFDPLGSILGPVFLNFRNVQPGHVVESGSFSRAAYALLLGAGIGLFIGLVERLAKVAWLRLALGRNEGKEWVVDAGQTFIGRSETANVPLFGDNAIAPVHACITRVDDRYVLSDQGSPSGTLLNGYPVTQPVPLFHGAMIQVGSNVLEFLMKVGTAPQRAAEALRAQQHYNVQVPVPAGGVPFGAPVAVPYQQPPGAQTQMAPSGYPSPQPYAMPQPGPSMPTQMVSPAPQATQMQGQGSQLVAIAGPLTGQRYAVGGLMEAGREAPGITLGFDTSASRKHASFSPSPVGIMVNDLGSTNGTFVNDQRVQAAVLNKGDLVRIGVTTFRVE